VRVNSGPAIVQNAGEQRNRMRFVDLAQTSADVAAVSGRLDKVARLAAVLAPLGPDEIEAAVAFLTGSTRQGRIGIGYAAIAKTIDLPPAAQPTLTIREADETFAAIAAATGKGSAGERSRRLAALVGRATSIEQDFLRRLLYGELRQGALAGVLIDAVARARGIPAIAVRRAAMLEGSLPAVARLAVQGGEQALTAAAVQLMRPLQPMLAGSRNDLDEALAGLEAATLEYKLDGARVQVHKDGDAVRIFSRTLNDVTASAPEIVAHVRSLPAKRIILDGEVLALRPDGSPHPFQVTMRRFGRTREIERGSRDLPLTPFFFDCLYLDGEPLIDQPLERRASALQDRAGSLAVPRLVRPTAEQARAFLDDTLARGHEGVMAKDLASPYAAGRRGSAWLKVKRARTLDLAVLAAEWGNGRRRGWLSNLHLGARDPATNAFVMLGKTFKGMTDQMLAWQTERLLALELGRDGHVVHVRPELVVEIAFNEIQASPVYSGGLALRFARVKRYRTDKTAADADTIHTVRAMAGTVDGPAA
jgi:DNA ligase-1